MPPYEEVPVAAAPEATVRALRDELRARGITEYVTVDHGHDMAAAGATAHPAWTVVFGNPAAGAAVLAHDLHAAVDIPLRLAVVADGSGASTIVLRPMETLLGGELADIAASLTGVLRSIAGAVRESAPAGRGDGAAAAGPA
jgi:uncharacterized protein (DUF302 family)